MIDSAWFGDCSFWTCTPDGPSTPFAGWLFALDIIRVLAFTTSVVILGLTPTALSRCMTGGQRARFLAYAFWCMASLSATAEHLGDDPGVRTLINFAAVAYAAYGMMSFLLWEVPGQRRPTAKSLTITRPDGSTTVIGDQSAEGR